MECALLSIKEAGKFLGYDGKSFGKTSINKHVNQGRLVKVKLRGRSFITRESAEKLIAENAVLPGE